MAESWPWTHVPQPCHIVRATTVNDGPLQSRCSDHLGCRYNWTDLEKGPTTSLRPYKADVDGLSCPCQSARRL